MELPPGVVETRMYNAAHYTTKVELQAQGWWGTVTVTGQIANEVLERKEYVEVLYERMLHDLYVRVGMAVLAMPYPEPNKVQPKSNHSSPTALDYITKDAYQAKIKALLETPKHFEVGPPIPKPTYTDKAAVEFQGVEGLDESLWTGDGGFA